MNSCLPLHSKALGFFDSVYKSLRFMYHYLKIRIKYGRCEYPYKPSTGNNVIRILATGPSLTKEIEEMKVNGSLYSDPLFVMNFFASTDLFVELKPSRYCLADPVFFKADKRNEERFNKLFNRINELVTWDMFLYVPNVSFNTARQIFFNTRITLIPISTLHFEGFQSKRNQFYKRGIATPSFVNVLIMIEYICLNEGFKKLFLYGADHTFLNNLIVDDDNVLRVEDTHFYGSQKVYAAVHKDGTPFRVSEYIYNKYLTFVEHDVMRSYSDYLGAEIINCTKSSWIDSYVRIAQLEKI